jgi:hypothetical protein
METSQIYALVSGTGLQHRQWCMLPSPNPRRHTDLDEISQPDLWVLREEQQWCSLPCRSSRTRSSAPLSSSWCSETAGRLTVMTCRCKCVWTWSWGRPVPATTHLRSSWPQRPSELAPCDLRLSLQRSAMACQPKVLIQKSDDLLLTTNLFQRYSLEP